MKNTLILASLALAMCGCAQIQSLPVRPTLGEPQDVSGNNLGIRVGPIYGGIGIVEPQEQPEVEEVK